MTLDESAAGDDFRALSVSGRAISRIPAITMIAEIPNRRERGSAKVTAGLGYEAAEKDLRIFRRRSAAAEQ
ncbi:MAG: hypothetical protein NVSMB29_02400 [Candidatus Dormibacteria bacterium]